MTAAVGPKRWPISWFYLRRKPRACGKFPKFLSSSLVSYPLFSAVHIAVTYMHVNVGRGFSGKGSFVDSKRRKLGGDGGDPYTHQQR